MRDKAPRLPASTVPAGSRPEWLRAGLFGAPAVQGLLELLLTLLGQRGLQHGAAVLAQRLGGLIRRDLLHHQEQRRSSRLQHAAHLVLELAVDARLGDLAHERAESS